MNTIETKTPIPNQLKGKTSAQYVSALYIPNYMLSGYFLHHIRINFVSQLTKLVYINI